MKAYRVGFGPWLYKGQSAEQWADLADSDVDEDQVGEYEVIIDALLDIEEGIWSYGKL
jgi:hypothetical protein